MKVLCLVNGGMGDQLLTLPALKYLHHNLRSVPIEVRLGDWNTRRELFEELLRLPNSVLSLDEFRQMPQEHFPVDYDWILDFDFRPVPGKMPGWLQGRAGYYCFERDTEHPDAFVLKPRDTLWWQSCFEMAFRIVCRINKTHFSIGSMRHRREDYRITKMKRPVATAGSRIRRFLSHAVKGQPRLAVTPGGFHPKHKRWPLERFAEVICHAVMKGISVFVLGSQQESDLAWRLYYLIRARPLSWRRRAPGNLSFLNGMLQPAELPLFLEKMDLHLTNDNGVAHIGGAINRPQIVLYRGNNSRYLTLGMRDLNFFSGNPLEMCGIRTEEVIQAVDEMMMVV